MKWGAVAAGLVIAANAIAVAPALRERAGDVTLVPVRVCRTMLSGGTAPEDPLALWFPLAPDSAHQAIPGLDSTGLQTLGFSRRLIGWMVNPRPEVPRGVAARPAWIRLRQEAGPGGWFVPVEVAADQRSLARDSLSLVVRGLVALSPVPRGEGQWLVAPRIRELLPAQLHVDREQAAALAPARQEHPACSAGQRLVLGNGRDGGVWIHSVMP